VFVKAWVFTLLDSSEVDAAVVCLEELGRKVLANRRRVYGTKHFTDTVKAPPAPPRAWCCTAEEQTTLFKCEPRAGSSQNIVARAPLEYIYAKMAQLPTVNVGDELGEVVTEVATRREPQRNKPLTSHIANWLWSLRAWK
jgi:hypothetical protein